MLNHSLVPVGSTGYDIDNSLRFNDDDSAYLSRTPSSAGNRKTWTQSVWVKRGNLGTANCRFWASSDNATGDYLLQFTTTGALTLYDQNAAFVTNALYRDTSAWYHIILSIDTTQATSTDRMKVWVNGEQVTSFASSTYPALNADLNYNRASWWHALGAYFTAFPTGGQFFDGYLAEVNFVDGQALTPADFGETDEDYGHWKAKAYEGTYGTNGFYLDFKNSGSLGNDASGEANNWTPNNLAATDQMLDSPTNNFCTLNPLVKGASLYYEGNLEFISNAGAGCLQFASQGMSSGKWYCEVDSLNTSLLLGVSTVNSNENPLPGYLGSLATSWGYYGVSGNKYNNSVNSAYGATYTTGDVIGIALDLDVGTLIFYKNGVSQGTAYSGLAAGTYYFATGNGASSSGVFNFGQDSSFAGNKTAQGNADDNGYGDFYYAPPTGYLALCTQNLPEPTVVPSEHFNTVLYTGNGSTQSITGVGFQPDWLWLKPRSEVGHHYTQDVLRGADTLLYTNLTNAENSATNTVTSFDADGFSLGNNSAINGSGKTEVAWNWKANGAGVSNTNGTITSTVSANVDAGFSIVSYTGNSTDAATIGHGLNQAPDMIITKVRNDDGTRGWNTYFADDDIQLKLNTTGGSVSGGDYHSSDATTYSITSSSWVNSSNYNYIAYAFHSVDGYSKVGSYTGNGSTDGTFVHCGFRPAYVMTKCTSVSGQNWMVQDSARDVDNPVLRYLYANLSNADEAHSSIAFDFNSNGYKIRTSNGNWNQSGATYIYLAFAEHPFKYTNAR